MFGGERGETKGSREVLRSSKDYSTSGKPCPNRMEKEPLEKERLKMKMLEMEGIRMGAGRSRRIEMGTQENTLVWEDTTYRIKERVGVETDIWRWGTCLQSSRGCSRQCLLAAGGAGVGTGGGREWSGTATAQQTMRKGEDKKS